MTMPSWSSMASRPLFALWPSVPQSGQGNPVNRKRTRLKKRGVIRVATYTPFSLKLLQANKCSRHGFIGQYGPVLLERALADLGVLGLWDGILEKCLLQLVQGDYDAKHLGERVPEILLGPRLGELDLL